MHADPGTNATILTLGGRSYVALPGEFYLGTFNMHLLTATVGGGQTINAVQTVVPWSFDRPIGLSERFRLWHAGGELQPLPNSRFALQTISGNFLSAADGGGRETQALHTTATTITPLEEFLLSRTGGSNLFATSIRAVSGNFLTTAGMGGRAADALRTDALTPGWCGEFFLRKIGDLGSGLRYYLATADTGLPLIARGGGNQVQSAFQLYYGDLKGALFTLIRGEEDTYALQVEDGHFVSAFDGGAGYNLNRGDDLQTITKTVKNRERFRFIDRRDGTYSIKTVSNNYLRVGGARNGPRPPDQELFSVDNNDLASATRFVLYLDGV